MSGFVVFILALLGVCAFAGYKAIAIVQQGFEYTVLRLGRYHRTLSPGFHLVVPFWESVDRQVNMKERVLDIDKQEVITKDNALVTVDGVVFFKVMHSSKAAYSVDDLELSLVNLTVTNLRTVMGSMTLDDLLSDRDAINLNLLRTIDAATDPWGVKVTRVEVKDISPPQDLVQAMAQQKKAEQLKRAQILEAEGERQSEILLAEGQKRARILEAEGFKEAAFLEAQARERQAEAEAKATEMVSAAIKSGEAQAIQYFVAQEYVKALTAFANGNNQKTVFMPLDATGVMGSIGSIQELFKSMK